MTKETSNQDLVDNAICNGFNNCHNLKEMTSDEIAEEMVTYCSEFENWLPCDLVPYIEIAMNDYE